MQQSTIKTCISGWFILVITLTPAPAQFDSQNCTLLGRWAEGECYDVLANVNIVYLGNGAYLQIMDFTDPVNPTLSGRIALASMVRGLALSGTKMYVADYDSDLCIVNIADAMNPAFVTQVKMTSHTTAATARDNHLFLANGEPIKILDISNINNPIEIGSCPSNGFARQIQVVGDYAFVANIFDISTLQAPIPVGYHKTSYAVCDIAVQDNLIFALDRETGLYIIRFDAPVAVDDNSESGLPTQFRLAQNYPNPFNPATEITYQLPALSHVQLEIYNLQRQEIKTLVDEFQAAGRQSVVWDGLDETGKKAAAGLYFYQMNAGNFTVTKKMLLVQ